MSNPLVSVILPVYNSEEYIFDAVSSITNQSYQNLEILVIVNGTTDNSIAEINKIIDSRIRIIEITESIGLIKALNIGISESKGSYIARMDADDISEPTRLQKQLNFLENNKDYGVCSSWFKTFGGTNSIVKYKSEDHSIKLSLFHECHICHPSVLIRKSILDKYKIQYSIDFPHSEDYALWVELSEKTKFYTFPEILLRYRDHESNISKIESEKQKFLSIDVKKYYFSKLGTAVNDQEVKIYTKFAYADFSLAIDEIFIIDSLIRRMFENLNKKIVSKQNLENYISSKWNTLVKNSGIDKSTLSNLHNNSFVKNEVNSHVKNIKIKIKLALTS